MGIGAIKTKLADIQNSIAGVKRAYAQAPGNLNRADLPAFVTFTGTAEYSSASFNAQKTQRNYPMRLYIAPVSAGIGGEAERLAEPFFSAVRTAFAPSTLGGLVVGARLTGDNGVSVLPYAGIDYLGIEFNLQTIELGG